MDSIRFIVEHPDWRSVLALNARTEVLAKYQWAEHVAQIIQGSGLLFEPAKALT
jgi:hypothetical protein